MKNRTLKSILTLLSLFFVLVIGLIACSNDFDVNADWKEITVVYGLLQQTDSIHYIRINKAYVGDNAYELAAVTDSLYHDGPLNIQMNERNDSLEIMNTFSLQKVNAADEGIEKEAGLFANSPYYIYKTTGQLNFDYTYELLIETPAQKIVTANTTLVEEFSIIHPNAEVPINLLNPFMVRWRHAQNAAIYELDVYIYYYEWNYDEQGTLVKTTERSKWNVFSNLKREGHVPGNALQYEVNNESFYYHLASSLNNKENLVKRELRDLEFVVHAGSEELKRFSSSQRAHFNITSTQVTPTYTNIEGGIGIFSSTYSEYADSILIGPYSLNLLACSDLTRHLKFLPHTIMPTYPSCE